MNGNALSLVEITGNNFRVIQYNIIQYIIQ